MQLLLFLFHQLHLVRTDPAKSFARCSPLRQLPGLSVLAHVSGAVVVCPSLAVGSAVMTMLVHLTHSQRQALSTAQL